MSTIRQLNVLGQMRLDAPHLRSIDSSVAADFDLLAGRIMAGSSPMVIKGFGLVSTTIGQAASALQIVTANGVMMHPTASVGGTLFFVPADRNAETLNASNAKVTGGFTANSVNYVGIDLTRLPDAFTTDLVQFYDPDLNEEEPETVPLGKTLDYLIVIGTQDFASLTTVAPLFKVTTDANNLVTVIEDARNMYFRLGSGGSVTDPFHTYAWPNGRTEVGDNSDFNVADKTIDSQKSWMDAAMTRLWELGGGEHWYSSTADRNIRLTRTGATFTNGEWFEWDGTNLHWKGLKFVFENSTASYNDVANQTGSSTGLTNLSDGDCIYVDIDRSTNRTGGTALVAVKTPWATLGTPAVPGSRYILAWRVGSNVYTRDSSFQVGATFTVASTTALGIVKLHSASLTPSTPVVLSDGDLGTANGVPSLDATKQCIVTATAGGTAFVGTGQGGGAGGLFTGGSTGVGVECVGKATSPGVLAFADVTNVAGAGIISADPQGNAKFSTSRLGMPNGWYNMIREHWSNAGVLTSSGTFQSANTWFVTVGGTGGTSVGGVANIGQLALTSAINIGSTSNLVFTSGACVGFYSTKAAAEFECDWAAESGGSYANTEIVVGFVDGTAISWLTASLDYAYFRCSNGNWLCETRGNGSVTSVDSGVAPTTNGTPQRLKVEYQGSGVEVGSTARVVFSIDGVQKANITTNLPRVAHAICLGFGAKCAIASSGTKSYYMGHLQAGTSV